MFELEERIQYLENKVYRLEAELKDSKEYQKYLDKVLHEVIDKLNSMNEFDKSQRVQQTS